MEETNNKKMNFFVRVYKSIFNFDTYARFANEPIGKAIKYLVILTLIFAIIVTIFYIGAFKSKISKGTVYLKENLDNMNFNNGIFSYNNNECTIYEDEENIIPIIIVDTGENPDIEQYESKIKLYNYGVIFLKDKMLFSVYAEGIEPQSTSISYSDYGIHDMNKEDILTSIDNPSIYIFLVIIVFIIEYIEYFIYILLNAIVLAVMGQLLAIILRLRFRFSETYKMAIYALTLPTILELLYIIINITTGFVIQYFNWMHTTISYIYICVAILMIKADFINMQKELIRIKMEEKENKDEQEEINEQDNTKDEEKEDKDENKEDKGEDDLKEQTDG